MKCYYFKENDFESCQNEHYPFCGIKCHERYAGKEIYTNKSRKLSIREMQQRLLEMGKPVSKTLFD